MLTGALERHTRDEAGAALKALGAKVVGLRVEEDVVRRRGRGPGSKYDKALELGVRVLDEDALERIIETGERRRPWPGAYR